ncbi:MAG: hypothetical protein IJM34_10640 [Lachnospiraceae bacterium]|nr:hypothetical protein [Lachnospiraceae bacterium]
MLKNQEIRRFKEGKDKQKSHSYLQQKYKKAVEHGFYFEALMISYNLVEDRLIALLHYAGIVSRDADDLCVTKKSRPYIRALLSKSAVQRINIKNISVKIDILRKICQSELCDEFISAVKEQFNNTLDIPGFITILDDCDVWKDTRNKYVHCLANRDPRDVEALAEEMAVEGHKIARLLDNCVGQFSKKNNIRKKFRIQ